ncbi:MAG: tetratricopeptide repeat protein [Candidatus Accumulibacter sp.]|nr:tetratricopeptide repeat protein [Accumulibacter sp.]
MSAVLAFLVSLAPFARAQTLAEVQALMKDEKLPQALRQIDRYIAAHPKDAQGPFTKGVILSEMGNPQEAIQVFLDLTRNFPELPEPHNNLAVLYARQKEYDKAQAALEMAIRTHPSYAIAYENLGDVYARLASQAYSKALQIDSENRTAQNKLEMIRELASIQERPGSRPITVAAKAASEPEKPAAPAPVSAQPPAPTPAATAPAAPAVTTRPADEAPAIAVVKPDDPDGKVQVSAVKVEDEIVTIVRGWADAWSRKNVDAYLAFYASDFQTPKGMTFRKWEEERRQRIDKPGRLQVVVNDIQVSVSGNQATARFRQQYTSATFKSQTNKTLVFVRSGNKWLIAQERVN